MPVGILVENCPNSGDEIQEAEGSYGAGESLGFCVEVWEKIHPL